MLHQVVEVHLPAGLQRALLSDLGDAYLVTLQSQKPDLTVGGSHAEAKPAPGAMCAIHTQRK